MTPYRPIPPERVGCRVDPVSVCSGAIFAVYPNPAGDAYPYRVDYLYGEASRFTRDTRCTATNMATGKRSVLRLGQLFQVAP